MKEHMTEKQIETAERIIKYLVCKKVAPNKDSVEVIVTKQKTETKGNSIVWLHLSKQPTHSEIWGTIFEDGSYLVGRAVKDRTVKIPHKTYKISELTEA